tara:strand:- start:834 stop:1322 length:489 start_codon:yes stop_codon:yes gene_type:complete
MTDIPPVKRLNLMTPDEIAECYDGVSDELARRLWASTEQLPMDAEGAEEPVAYKEINSITEVWDFFTEEEKFQINRIVNGDADANEARALADGTHEAKQTYLVTLRINTNNGRIRGCGTPDEWDWESLLGMNGRPDTVACLTSEWIDPEWKEYHDAVNARTS